MAIGSTPEYGTKFKSCREFTMNDWEEWWKWMRENWGENLQAGYANYVHNKNNRFYVKKDSKDIEIDRLNAVIDELRAEIQLLNRIADYS